MTPDRIVLDLTRLVCAAWDRTPTGIPRVELAYAKYLLAREPADVQFAVRDGIGRICLIERPAAADFVAAIERFWRDGVNSGWSYRRLGLTAHWLHAGLLLRGEASLRRLVAGSGGRTILITVSQFHADLPYVLDSLRRWGDVRLVYLVHDVLPAQLPEYFKPGAAARNRTRMRDMVRLADAVIANSAATRRDLLDLFGAPGLDGRTYVALLGGARLAPPPLAATAPPLRPYFVIVGTIEPRKNHLLLLNIWRRLGPDAPRLVVVGSRGWENENVIAYLERGAALRGIVEERNRVSDTELGYLFAGARALLFPSLAEGYGLPIAEALAAGVPVLCSDLAPFREVGGDVPEYLDPLDGPGWQRAILDYAGESSSRRAAQLERLRHWRAPSWEAHFAVLETVLAGLAVTNDAAPAGRLGARAGM